MLAVITDRTQRTPHNLLDEFRWARAFRRCRCCVDLLAITYPSHQLGTGRSQLIAGAVGTTRQRDESPGAFSGGASDTTRPRRPLAQAARVEDLIWPPQRAAPDDPRQIAEAQRMARQWKPRNSETSPSTDYRIAISAAYDAIASTSPARLGGRPRLGRPRATPASRGFRRT